MQYESRYSYLNNEIWVSVPNFEGLYEVSSNGRIRSLVQVYVFGVSGKTQRQSDMFMKFSQDKDGYLKVKLRKGNADFHFRVHRLVALSFIENTSNHPVVMHIDDDIQNNCVWNLMWGSISENTLSSFRNGRRRSLGKRLGQYSIDGVLVKEWKTYSEARKNTTVNIDRAIKEGTVAGGFKWRYITNEYE